MLDTETIKNISTFVEITMQVEERLRAKYDFEVEQVNKELAIAVEDRDKIAAHTRDLINENDELEEQVKDLEAQIEELAGQKERQAQTVRELMEVRDRQKTLIDDLEKEADSLGRELEAKQGPFPTTDEELQKKLDKAMDHIRRQGEEIDKLRAGAADPRWIPMSEKRPCGGATVIVCTKRGVVDVATETVDGWKRSTGKMAEPVAWMPLPVRYTGGEE